MLAVDDEVEVECPQCANDILYVEKIEIIPRDAALCRCGKCGWRVRVYASKQQTSSAIELA